MKPHKQLLMLFLLLTLAALSFPARAAEPAPGNGPAAPDSGTESPETKAPGQASVTQGSLIFGLQTPAPQVSSETNLSQPQITYKIQGDSDETYSPQAPAAVGVYTVRVVYPETETHLSAQATADFTIRAYITGVSLDPLPQVPSRAYNGLTQPVPVDPAALPFRFQVEGTSQQPRLGSDYELRSLTLSSPGTDTDPESRNVTAEIGFLDGMYAPAPELNLQFSFHADIVKAPLTVTARNQATAQGFLTGTDQVTVQGLAQGDVLDRITLTADGSRLMAGEAGIFREDREVTDQYEITYLPGKLAHAASVAEAPAGSAGLIYNGQAQPLLASPGTAENGQLLYQVRYAPSQSGEPELLADWSTQPPTGRTPGIYDVSFKAVPTGKVPELAESPEQTITVTLARRVLTVSAFAEKTYDGTAGTEAAVIRVDPGDSQPVPGDEVSVRSIEGSSFSSPDAGSGIRLTPGNVILTGKDAENYTVQISEFLGTIRPRPVTVTALPASRHYGQPDPALTFRVTGGIPGQSLEGALSRQPGEDVGTWPITQGTLTNQANPNYLITFVPDVLTIQPAQAELELTLSRHTARAGKTVKATVTARNQEPELRDGGWSQPRSLTLSVGDRTLTPKAVGDGVWEASFAVPRGSRGTLTWEAALTDENYVPARASADLRITLLGTNPMTGDQILIYGTLAAVTGLLLIGGLLLLHRRKK